MEQDHVQGVGLLLNCPRQSWLQTLAVRELLGSQGSAETFAYSLFQLSTWPCSAQVSAFMAVGIWPVINGPRGFFLPSLEYLKLHCQHSGKLCLDWVGKGYQHG